MTQERRQERGPALVFITAVSVRPEGGAVFILDPERCNAFAAMGRVGLLRR